MAPAKKPAPKAGKKVEAEATPKDTGRALAPIKGKASSVALPDDLAKMMRADSGKGLSKDSSDNTIPLIYVLQAQSPQVLKKKDTYIEGAEPGDFWLRNTADPIVKGEDGFFFQPCFFQKDIVEWIPRDDGGGYVGRHERMPGDAKKVVDKQANKDRFVSPRGTEYVETRYHGGYVLGIGNGPMPFIIPLAGSGHKFSKDWQMFMNSQNIPDVGPPPAWGMVFKLKINPMSNKKGDWFGWDYQLRSERDGGPWMLDTEQYLVGKSLNEALSAGIKTMEDLQQPSVDEATDDDAAPAARRRGGDRDKM